MAQQEDLDEAAVVGWADNRRISQVIAFHDLESTYAFSWTSRGLLPVDS